MLSLLLAAALAAADFEVVREEDGCTVSMRGEDAPGGAAMRAECAWPEVEPARLAAILDDIDGYDRWVWPVAASEVRRRDAGRALVWQRQRVWGLADREVLLWARREAVADGLRLSWTTASDEPLEVAPGAVRTPRNEGYWEVRGAPDGGSLVVHEIAVDPGGLVPRWLIAMTRTRGFARVMSDARAVARGG